MNEYKEQIGAPHLTVSFNLAMAKSLLAMQFDMVHRDSLQTGMNLFLFGDIDEEASNQLVDEPTRLPPTLFHFPSLFCMDLAVMGAASHQEAVPLRQR